MQNRLLNFDFLNFDSTTQLYLDIGYVISSH